MTVPLRVLESVRALKPTTNPYIVQLVRALEAEPGLEVLTFSWRTALVGHYDVFHVHWPEQLMGGHTVRGRVARRLLTTLFVLRLWVTRTALVRTRHNLERPSGLGWYDHRLLDALDRLTSLVIRLNESTEVEDRPCATVLHGDYQDWFAPHPPHAAVPGRFGYVGLIRRYKGLEDLVAAFAGLTEREVSLHVAGSPSSEELAQVVRDAAGSDDRVTARLEFLDDAAFVEAITTAQLVVLPYRHMHNSGAVLAALSLHRPVLVPDNEVNRALAHEVGPGWVHTFSGTLGPDDLRAGLVAVGSGERRDTPDLARRAWSAAGAQHREAFARAARRPRPGRPRGR